MFTPKLIICLREGYDREDLVRDVTAGVVVGIVALPLSIAFAIASGVAPERGIYTAIIAGFLMSALGGSRVQIGGPTGAFVVIVYDIVTRFGYSGLVFCMVIASVMLIGLGVARLGTLIKFIPYPVITGFTSGIAVIIFSSQIRDLLGLKMGSPPADFMEKWVAMAEHIRSFDLFTVAVSAGTLAVLIIWPWIPTKIPGPFVAMVLATLAVQLLDLPVETIGSRFGSVPTRLPAPSWPSLPWQHMKDFIVPAFTVALLASIESLLSAVVADGMIGSRHKSNVELVGLGVANLGAALFGGIPATGAIARTATNVRTGGRTPVAGMVHALTLLLILIFFGRWAAMIPLSALAAVLVVVSYHMSEWRSFRGLLRAPAADVTVLILTFGLTVFVDLTVAVQVGVVVAALLFMKRMADVTSVEGVREELREKTEDPAEISHIRRGARIISGLVIPREIEVYEVNGPFFFGAADKLRDILDGMARPPKVFILRMRNVPTIDATGIHALEQLCIKAKAGGTMIILSGVQREPFRAIVRGARKGLFERRNFARDFKTAVERGKKILAVKSQSSVLSS